MQDERTDQISRRLFLKASLAGLGALSLGLILKNTYFNLSQSEGLVRPENLPPDLSQALQGEFGNIEGLVSWENLIGDLSKASIVAIGDNHTNARDIATAGDIIRSLGQQRSVVVAVERFSSDLQPILDKVNAAKPKDKAALMKSVFDHEAYASVWNAREITSLAAMSDSPAVTKDDQREFENLMQGLASEGIPIIGLDVSLTDRRRNINMDDPIRNSYWAQRILDFQQKNPATKNDLMVAIGGTRHMGSGSEYFPDKLQKILSPTGPVVAVGQHFIGSGSQKITQIEALAKKYGMADIIVKKPQMAGPINTSFMPGDYWIAVH